jgi:hypothetical protein
MAVLQAELITDDCRSASVYESQAVAALSSLEATVGHWRSSAIKRKIARKRI